MRFKSFQIFTISRDLKLSLGKCREIKTTKFTTPNSCKASKTKIKSVQIKQIQLSNVLKSRIQTFAIQKNNEQNHQTSKSKRIQTRSLYIELLTEQFQCTIKFLSIHVFIPFLFSFNSKFPQPIFQRRINVVSTLWVNVEITLIRRWKWKKIQCRIFNVPQRWYNVSARSWNNAETTLYNVETTLCNVGSTLIQCCFNLASTLKR